MNRPTALTAVALAVLFAACGSSGSSKSSKTLKNTTTTSRSASGASPTSSTSAASANASSATVRVGSSSLGQVLTDPGGKTLYLYMPDQGTTSKVPSGILAAWPPLVATGTPTAGPGLDPSKLTTARQADGRDWVAYNGHLLYRYAGDQAPGDTKGQGLGGVWFAASAQGEKIAG